MYNEEKRREEKRREEKRREEKRREEKRREEKRRRNRQNRQKSHKFKQYYFGHLKKITTTIQDELNYDDDDIESRERKSIGVGVFAGQDSSGYDTQFSNAHYTG